MIEFMRFRHRSK